MSDSNLISGLEQAVTAAPENTSLRLHLAELLLKSGRAGDALAQAVAVLAQTPDDGAALSLAAEAAEATGAAEQAAAYRRMAAALVAAEAKPQPPPAEAVPIPLHVVEGDGDSDGLGEVERPRVTLSDVGGMEAAKRRLEMSFLAPLRNPELRAMYGKSLRGGLLLWGPPGCGKTFIARAAAGELSAKFIGVALADVLDMWIGLSEKNIHGVFELARRNAPCVLFIDELDALGQKRTNMRHAPYMRNVIAQLLAELDGALTDNEGVFVLGATNAPWDIDPALKRPGRFDRSLLVLPPDEPARAAILEYHLRERPLAGDRDLADIARRTDGFSGADLAQLCESASEKALMSAIETGTARPITQRDLRGAREEMSSSVTEWFTTARNFAMFQNEGGMFDELLGYMNTHRLK